MKLKAHEKEVLPGLVDVSHIRCDRFDSYRDFSNGYCGDANQSRECQTCNAPKRTKTKRQVKLELQVKFCEGCPTDAEKCPMPKGPSQWELCNWKATYIESGLWRKQL